MRMLICSGKWPAIVSMATVGYFVIAHLLFTIPTQAVVSYFTHPAINLIFVWTPVLQPLGLTEGTIIVAPSVPACVAIVLLYSIVAYFSVAWFSKLKHRTDRIGRR